MSDKKQNEHSATRSSFAGGDGENAQAPPPAVDDLHRIFPEIPSNEKAIRNFVCSHLVRKFMCVGRLYLTPTRLCFIGSISSNVSFEWPQVLSLEKKSSIIFDSIEMKIIPTTKPAGGLPPPAIDEVFTGFVNGSDEPYQIMRTLWNVKKNFGPASTPSSPQLMINKTTTNTTPPNSSSNLNKSMTAATSNINNTNASFPQTPPASPQNNTQSNNTNNSNSATPTPTSSGQLKLQQEENAAGVEASSSNNNSNNNFLQAPTPKSGNTSTTNHPLSPPSQAEKTPTNSENKQQEQASKTPTSATNLDDEKEMTPSSKTPTANEQQQQQQVMNNSDNKTSSAPTTPRPKNSSSAAATEQQSPPVVVPMNSPASVPPSPSPIVTTDTTENKNNDNNNKDREEESSTTPLNLLNTPPVASPNSPNNNTTSFTSEISNNDDNNNNSSNVDNNINTSNVVSSPLTTQQQQQQENISSPLENTISNSTEQQQQQLTNQSPSEKQLTSDANDPSSISTRFPGVPKTERVIDSFQCSYIQGVHRYGKMAITKNFLLFSSMVCNPVSIKLSEVETLAKTTSLVILEGFSVNMKDGAKYEFTSFAGTREKAYTLICDLVRTQAQVNAVLGVGSPPSSATLNLDRNKNESAFQKKKNITAASASAAAASSSTTATPKEGDDDEENDHEGENDKEKQQEEEEEEESPTSTTSEDKNSFVSKVVLPDPSTWTDIGDDIEQFDKLVTHDFPIQDGVNGLSPPSSLMETVLLSDVEIARNATLTDVFRVCFDDEAEFAFEYRKQRPPVGDTDTVVEAWRPTTTNSSSVSGGIRTMTCNSTIRAIMSCICKYTEFQRFLLCQWKKQPTLIVQYSGQASGATFSDTFRAETMMIYTPSKTQPNNLVCSVYFYINNISAPFLLKSKIKSSAFSECGESYKTFFRVGNQYIIEDQSKPSSSPGKKKTLPVSKKSPKFAPTAVSVQAAAAAAAAAPVPAAAAAASVPAAVAAASVVVAPSKPLKLEPPLQYVEIGFLGFAFLYAFRAIFSLWWSAPSNPEEMPNYVAWNHLLSAVCFALMAYAFKMIALNFQ